MSESEITQPAPFETSEAPQSVPQEVPQEEPEIVAKVEMKRKPKEPSEPKRSRDIAVSVSQTEYFDDPAPPTPPATEGTPTAPYVIKQQPRL